MATYNEDEMMDILKAFVHVYRTQRKAAEQLGITESHLSMILSGERPIPEKILQVLNIRRVTNTHYENGYLNS